MTTSPAVAIAGVKKSYGQNVALIMPGYVKRFTVAFYTQSLVPHAMPQDSLLALLQSVFKESVSAPQAFLTLLLILAAGLGIATRAVERREYVLEQ